jgi:hypothetical protein
MTHQKNSCLSTPQLCALGMLLLTYKRSAAQSRAKQEAKQAKKCAGTA